MRKVNSRIKLRPSVQNKGMMNPLLVVILMVSLTLTPGQSVLTVTPENKTLPSGSLLQAVASGFVRCEIEANFTLSDSTVQSQWILPNGTVLELKHSDGKYVTTQGPVEDPPGFETLILIQELIYSDAGTYTCQVQDIRDPDNHGQWMSSEATLQLLVELTADKVEVVIFDNATSVSLSCEMSLYLRPDEDLQWFRGGQLISDTNERYTITYTDGTEQGQFGRDTVGNSQVSTLVISQPQPSDSANYTCAIRNTEQSQDIQLTVESTGGPDPSTVQPSSTTSSISSSEPSSTMTTSGSTDPPTSAQDDKSTFPLPIIIGAIAGALGIVVVILVVIIIMVSCQRRSHTVTVTENGNYAALNGGTSYVQSNQKAVSPIPKEPPRAGNSEQPGIEMGGYDRPNHKRSPPPINPSPNYERLDGGVKYDPYYDSPDDLKHQRAPAVPKNPPPKKSKPNTSYDEVEMFKQQGKTSTLDMRSVPSPAVVLSGSLNRQIEQKNPDFAYPSYQDGFDLSGEPDYDQIYSEPLDPTMLHSNVLESLAIPEEAVPYSAIYDDPANPFSDTDVPAPFKITKSNIIEIRKLGTGQFGQVILAKTKNISLKDMGLSETDNDSSKSILVAIKKLKPDAESGLMKAFEKEVKFMSRLKHDNVVRLLAVCSGAESFIMMEYMENGDLNQFLQKQTLMSDSISGLQENQITPIILLYIGVQIASGMHYLGSRRFVHRDLATRNCLVGKDFIVKISDFGMSRSLYESAYYRVQGTLVLPIRWMACETFYGKFSVKSDSWAFGVTLWEIYTLGKVDPYEDLTDEEVIADAIRGPERKILPQTTTCPQEVYEIMQRCWVHEPSMRADFGEIYSRLFMIYTRQAL